MKSEDLTPKLLVCFMVLFFASTYANAEIRSGSGFIVTPDGYVVTNQHVIKNAKEIVIKNQAGRSFHAKQVAVDEIRDLALLKIDAADFPHVKLGDSSKTRVLDTIFVLGFPLPDVIGTEVSAYEGKINAIRTGSEASIMQLDANINPGNSGGPVANSRGEVVGIIVAKLNALLMAKELGSIPERVNFAIPIDAVKSLLTSNKIPYDSNAATTADLSAQSIFTSISPATVLIVVRAEDMRSDVSADENLRTKIISVINNILDERIDFGERLTFYADEVDYFDKGIVDKNFIYNNRIKFMQRWPHRRYWLKKISEIVPDKSRTFAVARYTIGFEVLGKSGLKKGEAENAILIGNLDSVPKIYLIKEWITARHSN